MKLRVKKYRFLTSWLLSCCLIFAATVSVDAASYLLLTDLGSSAEMIRKGNIEGYSVGSNSVFENPAGLYRVKTGSASVFSSQIMKEVNYRNLSVAFKTDFGVLAVGYMDAGVDDIISTKMQENGDIVADGVFSYQNRIMKLGFQRSITDALHLGINGVGYFNEIHTYSGSGYNIDIGGIYNFTKLEVSLFTRNLIPLKVSYSDSEDTSYSGEEDLPLQMVFGARYPLGDLDVMGQYKYDGVNSLVSAGLDYTPSIISKTVTLSAGYKEFSILDDISSTITMGIGLNILGVSLDYAYEKSEHFEFDSNNFASIGFDF